MRFYILIVLFVSAVALYACNSELSPKYTKNHLSLSSQYDSRSAQDRVAAASQHVISEPGPMFLPVKYLQYEDQGERFEYWNYTGGSAWQVAAEYCAMYTLDFDVSVQDVISTGLWPYDFLPDDVDLDLRFHTKPEDVPQLMTSSLNPNLLKLSEEEFLLRAKDDILRWFHKCYFFQVEEPRETQDEDLDSHRLAAFWINPFSGEEMQDQPGLGDYQLYDLMSFACCSAKRRFSYEVQIPVINLHPTYQVRSADKSHSQVEGQECCVFKREQNSHMGVLQKTERFSQVFEDVCVDGDPCTVTFEVTSNMWIHTWYSLVRRVSCDDPGTLAEGEILVQPGRRTPDTVFGWAGSNVTIFEDECVICLVETGTATEGQQQYLNFIADLTNASEGGVATAQGPVSQLA